MERLHCGDAMQRIQLHLCGGALQRHKRSTCTSTSEEIVAAKQLLGKLKVGYQVEVFFIDKANRFSLHEAIALTHDI